MRQRADQSTNLIETSSFRFKKNTFVSKYKHSLSEKHKQHLRPLTPTTKASETTCSTSRRGSRHGLRGVLKANRLEMTRHGRRHESVRDASRGVWEATTPVFEGSTQGSKTHRSSCQNRDDRHRQIVPPSVNLKGRTAKMLEGIKTVYSRRNQE